MFRPVDVIKRRRLEKLDTEIENLEDEVNYTECDVYKKNAIPFSDKRYPRLLEKLDSLYIKRVRLREGIQES